MQEEASTRIEDLITVVENQITDQEPKKSRRDSYAPAYDWLFPRRSH